MVCTRAKGWGDLAVHLHHGHRPNHGTVVLQKREVKQKATTFSQGLLCFKASISKLESLVSLWHGCLVPLITTTTPFALVGTLWGYFI